VKYPYKKLLDLEQLLLFKKQLVIFSGFRILSSVSVCVFNLKDHVHRDFDLGIQAAKRDNHYSQISALPET